MASIKQLLSKRSDRFWEVFLSEKIVSRLLLTKSFISAQLVLLALVLIYAYRSFSSSCPACRFYPSCSCYAEEALRTYGFLIGIGLTCRRILRCHPWGGAGIDLVPQSLIKQKNE